MITRWPIRSVELVLHGLRCGVNIRDAARATVLLFEPDTDTINRAGAALVEAVKQPPLPSHLRAGLGHFEEG